MFRWRAAGRRGAASWLAVAVAGALGLAILFGLAAVIERKGPSGWPAERSVSRDGTVAKPGVPSSARTDRPPLHRGGGRGSDETPAGAGSAGGGGSAGRVPVVGATDGAGPEAGAGSASAAGPRCPADAEGRFAAVRPAAGTRAWRKPAAVRGVYLNAWVAGSARHRAELLELAGRTEVNAFVIDAKDNSGYASYASGVALAREIGAHCDPRIANVAGVLSDLRERGIYAIARIVVFQDPVLAERRPDLAIRHRDGGAWRDHHGQAWVDPHNRQVWDYHVELAREAVGLGFAEVQWDYVRFPDVPPEYMATAVYPARGEETRAEAIRDFLRYSRERLADLGVPVTADVFGLTVSAADDMGIGQDWSMLAAEADVLLPMVYPSHFAPGSYGITYPNAAPYETVRRALAHAVRRTRARSRDAAIRPWLQDFTLGDPVYGAAEVRAQIQAVYDVGLQEWILWNAAGRYTAEALGPRPGVPAADALPDPE